MTSELITIEHNQDDSALWIEAARRWLEAVESRRGSIRSRTEYQKSIKIFFEFVGGKHPATVTGSDCQRWAAAMQEAGLSPSTIRARLAAVSSFYNFVSNKFEAEPGRYLHQQNPASAATRPHVNPYEKSQGLAPEQARALLKACDRATVKGLRDFALLSFYLYTARRRAEICRLTWGDIREGSEPGLKEYRYTGKGNKTGWRELPAPVWTALVDYLKAANRLSSMTTTSPLFVATINKPKGGDQPLNERTVNQIVDRAASLAGLEHLKVHSLRHSAAKVRRASGEGIESISLFLDHSSIATTQIYLNSMEAKKDVSWQKVEALIGL